VGETSRVDLSEDASEWGGRREKACRVLDALPSSSDGEAYVEGAAGSESAGGGGRVGDEASTDEEGSCAEGRDKEEAGTRAAIQISKRSITPSSLDIT